MFAEKNISNDIKSIFTAALEKIDPYKMIISTLKLKDDILQINNSKWDLSKYNKIIVLGTGKATAKMALGLEEVLGNRISKGLISVKEGHTENLKYIETIEAAHPVPDEKSYEAAAEIYKTAMESDEKNLIINLISGGGSALLSYPASIGDYLNLSLEEKQATTKELLKCGADIKEINCIRKHLSRIKGGRLAEAMWPSESINLILSDVVGDDLDTIASGLTSPDRSTFKDALEILDKYEISNRIPENALKIIELGVKGKIKETPKPGDNVFSKVNNIIIGSNFLAVNAAQQEARRLSYNCMVLSTQLTGEAKEAAKFLISIAKEVNRYNSPVKKPACILCGGETTVTIRGNGKGGRNQEMSLAFLDEIRNDPENCGNIHFLSGATDGNDGPTDACGAIVSSEVLNRALKHKLSINDYLKNNDSYNFFDKIGSLHKTGPTNTNVCDIQIMIVK